MPPGMELPESVVFTFTHIPETILSDLANQILWQGLVVGNLKEALCSSSSLRNGSNPASVGEELRCALCAEKANRNRGWTKKGVPHLIASSASGATHLRIAYSRRKCGWPSRGAARIYLAIVVGRWLAISFASITNAGYHATNAPVQRGRERKPKSG